MFTNYLTDNTGSKLQQVYCCFNTWCFPND